MEESLSKVLRGELEDNILPFLWLHGEPEDTLRHMMAVIYDANIRAVCLESRPHPDYLSDGWWHDLDILLDEARRRGMRVWILDDSHFPTGYASGALQSAEALLCRQFLTRPIVVEEDKIPTVAPPWRTGRCEQSIKPTRLFSDDRVAAVLPCGNGKIRVSYLTRNRGPHRAYINMLSEQSCRVLLDTVYEAHYRHYAADFGKTIAGFFSDEPELGNDHLYEYGKRLWELDDLPWSEELELALRRRWEERFEANLILLWEPNSPEAAQARYATMDELTRAVSRCFSRQIGDWCHDHGIEYIGHIIEDNDQHTRTGSSLGHFFRAMAGQDMAGIDDIGNQVLPGGEWNGRSGPWNDYRDGLFYHYVLGKLGSSLAALDKRKQGHCLCEIFGNYGWAEGVKLEKYLVDHFLVRGVNRFVPHAFNPAPFPDPDCPPHFYAHGNNPQYRAFGALMGYMSRLCTLLSGGKRIVSTAVLYNAAAEWCGDTLPLSALAIPLLDQQIDFDFLPEDAFTDRETYRLPEYPLLLVPGSQYLPGSVVKGLIHMAKSGTSVWFVGRKPEGLCEGGRMPDLTTFPLVSLSELSDKLNLEVSNRVFLSPPSDRVRALRYRKEKELVFLVNEGAKPWRGTLRIPNGDACCAYNAWDNRLEVVEARQGDGRTELEAELVPGKSLCLLFGYDAVAQSHPISTCGMKKTPWNDGWIRRICQSASYPNFREERAVSLPDELAAEKPRFSGFVRYEKPLALRDVPTNCILEITEASEAVEVFVNGKSLGIQISAPYLYELSGALESGENQIAVEVATTLERALCTAPKGATGLNGEAILYFPL